MSFNPALETALSYAALAGDIDSVKALARNEAHALLDEYRAACRAAAPMQEPPTFMGEPVVMPNAGDKPPQVGLD